MHNYTASPSISELLQKYLLRLSKYWKHVDLSELLYCIQNTDRPPTNLRSSAQNLLDLLAIICIWTLWNIQQVWRVHVIVYWMNNVVAAWFSVTLNETFKTKIKTYPLYSIKSLATVCAVFQSRHKTVPIEGVGSWYRIELGVVEHTWFSFCLDST
jgi:hypothetical protein